MSRGPAPAWPCGACACARALLALRTQCCSLRDNVRSTPPKKTTPKHHQSQQHTTKTSPPSRQPARRVQRRARPHQGRLLPRLCVWRAREARARVHPQGCRCARARVRRRGRQRSARVMKRRGRQRSEHTAASETPRRRRRRHPPAGLILLLHPPVFKTSPFPSHALSPLRPLHHPMVHSSPPDSPPTHSLRPRSTCATSRAAARACSSASTPAPGRCCGATLLTRPTCASCGPARRGRRCARSRWRSCRAATGGDND